VIWRAKEMTALQCIVVIDMDRHTLSVSISGHALVDAGVSLPDAVRPWVLTVGRRAGDTICLREMDLESVPGPVLRSATHHGQHSSRVVAAFIKREEAKHRKVALQAKRTAAAEEDRRSNARWRAGKT